MAFRTMYAQALTAARKGRVKRTPREEAALRVRMLDGRHTEAIIDEVYADLGAERAGQIGKVDLHSNALVDDVERRGKAYLVPPFCEGLSPELAGMIGDMTAKVTQQRYATIGGRPMPVLMSSVCHQVLRYRLGANWCGTLIGWVDRSARPYLQAVTPDDLEVHYRADDPLTPSVIDHYRMRVVDGAQREVIERYDITDEDEPRFQVLLDAEGHQDITANVMDGVKGWDGRWHKLWRYADNRPFHRIIISGDPRNCYRYIERVEGTLRLASGYTSMWAGMRDAGHPSRHAVGLRLVGQSSQTDSDDGESGVPSGPEVVHIWEHADMDKPGMLHQFGPGYDPKIVYDVLRAYGHDLIDTTGLSVNAERTGGEPTATEQAALQEAIAATYGECRGHDGLVLRRIAATCNRASELTDGATPTTFPERSISVMYREEISAALGLLAQQEQAADAAPDNQGDQSA